MSLKAYRAKRDLKRTPEPAGARTRVKDAPLRFVVQRHKASHLHYDFRLEMEGVLKSWAVPKGPSLSPDDRRLAMMVEDHPYDYKDFHGTIPEGHYGAGLVEIWDRGTYEPVDAQGRAIPEKQLLHDLAAGSIKFKLKGRKLKGGFALVRMKDPRSPNAWLLIKHRDAHAVEGGYDSEEHTPARGAINAALRKEGKEKTASKAVRTKRAKAKKAPAAVRAERGVVRRNAAPAAAPQPLIPISVRGAGRTDKVLDPIRPMLAKQRADAFDGDDWVFEIKWDGYRAIAETGGPTTRLYSRNGLSFERAYPGVFAALRRIRKKLVLDGEIVALDPEGRPDFQRLQNVPDKPDTPVVYYVFDLLELNGRSVERRPLVERKRLLRRVIKDSEHVRYSDHVERTGKAFFALTRERGLEGMIAKLGTSPYLRGTRSGNWLKVKHHEGQEVVIGGYTAPRNSRQHFGALLLGVYEGGVLHYVGHTGTGFSHDTLRSLSRVMRPLVRPTSPFAERVKANTPAVWLEPKLVCNVEFTEWTTGGHMRHPVFMGLRADKPATDVHLERTTPMPKKKSASRRKAEAPPTPGTEANADDRLLKVGTRTLKLTNQQKPYWPEDGITKGDLIAYYDRMHRWVLPYLKDRPESLKRNPGGIHDPGFYQKDAGADTPAWVRIETIGSKSRGGTIRYIVCNDRATLLYLANLGCIELNPWTSRVGHLDKPDHIVIDLDPGERTRFDHVVEAALATKVVADEIGAAAWCKTSGASGLHVYLPTHARYTYAELAPFAEQLARRVAAMLPRTTTVERPIDKRRGLLYIDHLQNRKGQTLACAYSVRPMPGATVSTPLQWKEVVLGLDRTRFNMHTVPQRVERMGDLFAGVLGKGIDLRKCLRALERLG